MSVVIVGASVAGVRTAQALRAGGYHGSLVLVGEERHQPYDRPPLSKGMLAADASDELPALLSPEQLESLELRLLLGTRATALDPTRQVVLTNQGERLGFEELVVATGLRPRSLPGPLPDGVYTLRTAADASALREELERASRVVVVGGGFIGAEFASAAHARGTAVSIVETQPVPMANVLGSKVGSILSRLHAEHGVEVHAGAAVAAVDEDQGRVSGVVLEDGRRLPADLVVVGIGCTPATEWLESSGLPLENGVCCDADLRIRGHRRLWAAGDVARFPHPLYGQDTRIEHWTNANEHGALVAAGILGQSSPPLQVPYVWSDQYGSRIQIVGRPATGTLHSVHGDLGDPPLVAVYTSPTGTVVGGFVLDGTRPLMKLRKAIARRASADELELFPRP